MIMILQRDRILRMMKLKIEDANTWGFQSTLRYYIELSENPDPKLKNGPNIPSIKHIPSIKDLKLDVYNNRTGSYLKDERYN